MSTPAPPVVLVHASRTSPSMWRAQREVLERAGVRVVAPMLPGHGDRQGEEFTVDVAVDAIHEAVEQVGGRAFVVGLSVGGYVAIEHRARFPEQSVGLMAVSCSTDPSTPLRGGWQILARWIESWPDSGAALNGGVVRATVAAGKIPDLEGDGFSLTVMSQIIAAVGGLNPREALGAASSPVWIVNGTWDHFRTGEQSFVSAARTGGACTHLVHVPRAKHLVNLDQPVPFARVVLEALAELRTP